MGVGSSSSLSPLDYATPTRPSRPHPRLGPEECGCSSSPSISFSLPFVRGPSSRQQTSQQTQFWHSFWHLRRSSPRSTSPRRIPISQCVPIFTGTSPCRTWASCTFFAPFPSALMSLHIFLRSSSLGLSNAFGPEGFPFSPTWTTLSFGTGTATSYWPRYIRSWCFCRIWASVSNSKSLTLIPLRRRFGWVSTGCLRRATGIFQSRCDGVRIRHVKKCLI